MQALILQGPGRLQFDPHREEPPADPSPFAWTSPVLVRVAACGICGSDIPRAFEVGGAYHYPLILGHEFSGVVEEDSGHWKRGDRVAVFPLIPRPGEPLYETGDYAQTTGYDYFGSRRDGGMQDLLWIPSANLFRVPDRLSLLSAACTEPAAVALHGVRKMRILGGETALVIGGGPIGLMAAQWLRILGCGRVLVADVDQEKLTLADSLGLEPVDSRKGPLDEQIKSLTGDGAQKVVEACGLPSTFVDALGCASAFGEIVFMGNIHGEFRLPQTDFSSILRRELTIYGTWNSKVVPRGQDDWSATLAAMDHTLQVSALISHAPLLSEGVEAFHAIRDRSRSHIKTVFRVTPSLCSLA
jgi:L-iditol 2-dehydrogenase